MKKSNVLSALSIVFVWILATGCSTPSLGGNEVNTPPDVCTGAGCDITVDGGADIVTGNDATPVDVPDTGGDNVVPPDEITCEDACEDGQIKCQDEQRYLMCKLGGDGCWDWDPMWVECKGESVCYCTSTQGTGEEVCALSGADACFCDDVAHCEGKECGADGCGGTCGECGEGQFCTAFGLCDTECPNDCAEGETKCNGELVQHCINLNADAPAEEPCWTFDAEAEECPANQTCDADASGCVCEVGELCGAGCCAQGDVCLGGACCTPDCDGKVCGDDGCGGSCGECAEAEFCNAGQCEAECDSECPVGDTECNQTNSGYRECQVAPGTEACGKWSPFFGCGPNQACADGTCECQPQCAKNGWECGDDGCGGSCGQCDDPEQCTADKVCACDCTGVPAGKMCDMDNLIEYPNQCEALCANAVNLEKGPCPTCQDDCTQDELSPQQYCGFDNVTYPNFCELKCAIAPDCVSPGSCPQIEYAGACKPGCCKESCNQSYDPICGNDGTTYCHKCDLLNCGPGVEGIYCVGECLNETACPVCGDECDPVCGLKGDQRKTFMNACIMDCQGAEFLWDGECCLQCDDVDAMVCGKTADQEFKTFKNDCYLNCQGPEFQSLYEVPKTLGGDFWIEVCEDCQCDLSVAEPVCGDNYQTYSNACALQCAHAADPSVGETPKCAGECFSDECPCPPALEGLAVASQVKEGDPGIRGVCGADGNTYGNECGAAKAQTLVVSQIWCEECAGLCGEEAYAPACCDGVTYPNLCVPGECNDLIDVATMCNKGACCQTSEDCPDGQTCNPKAGTNYGICE